MGSPLFDRIFIQIVLRWTRRISVADISTTLRHLFSYACSSSASEGAALCSAILTALWVCFRDAYRYLLAQACLIDARFSVDLSVNIVARGTKSKTIQHQLGRYDALWGCSRERFSARCSHGSTSVCTSRWDLCDPDLDPRSEANAVGQDRMGLRCPLMCHRVL